MFFVMAIAGMVCTALSVSGQTITDLKTGYWLGSTPAAQEKVKFLGVLVLGRRRRPRRSSLLAQTFQFGEAAPGDTRPVLASPQASIMKALVEGFMSRQPVAYILFGAGAMIAVAMEMLARAGADLRARHVPAARAQHAGARRRRHLPLTSTSAPRRSAARAAGRCASAAIIIASGLMAGGALGGVFGAGAAPLPLVPRGPDQAAVLRQRSGLADRQRGRIRPALRLSVAGRHEEGEARLTDRLGPR